MNRELQRWTVIVAAVVFVFGVLAAFVPQWIYIQFFARSYGLRKMCVGSYCGALNLTELSSHPDCRAGCWPSNNFNLRWNVIEAFIWIAAASSFFAALMVIVGFRRDLLHTARLNTFLILFLALGVAAYVICISVLGGTVRLHNWDYGCTLGQGCLYWGASSICVLVGMSLLFIALVLGVASVCCTAAPTARGALLAWCFLLCVASLAFAMGSALSHRWVIRSSSGAFVNAQPRNATFILPPVFVPGTNNLANWVSLGPLNWCFGGSCHPLNQNYLLAGSCGRDRGDLRARFGVGVAFLCLGFIFALLVVVWACFNWPVLTFVFVALSLAAFIVGIAVLGDTFDWWLHCGERFCDWVSLNNPGAACEWGFAFASAVVAVTLMALLFVAFLIMWCCRREDRAPDATQVAVTTVGQPQAGVVAPAAA